MRRSCRTRRRSGWGPEALETRDLPSVAPMLFAGLARQAQQALSTVVQGIPSPQPAQEAPTGQPTPHELAREAFHARFQGPYTVGPGRFTDQAQQVFIKGGGNSTAFRHGNLLMSFTTPADPSGTITGLASLVVKNVSNTGNNLVLDLVGDPQSLEHGLPTRFTWTVDGSSGGTFSNATGQGTAQVIYMPSGRLPRRATGAGTAGVIFTGLVNTTGVGDLLRIAS